MATITLHLGEQTRSLSSLPGETFHALLSRYGVYHHAPCGGQGLCKQCKILVRGELSPPSTKEYEFLTDDELLKGVRYCCLAMPAGDCEVFLEEASLVREEPCQPTILPTAQNAQGVACGIDIGTTTLAVYLYSRVTGKPLAVVSAQNRQSAFGDDVISRIHAVTTLKALPVLQKTLREQLTDLVEEACRHGGILPDQITACAVAANTTMLHLLTGLDPTSIAVAPFTPQSLFGTMYRGEQLDLPLSCEVYLIPCVSAYVGGDITAGMAACRMDTTEDTCLLIDVGTNGEMALSHKGQIFALSTAAGPAFEGAHIRHGVGGVPGAICKINEQGFETIGNQPPVGICGSGLLDGVAMMLRKGVLDETGYLEEDFPLTQDGRLCITPKDIREVQLAKSAICSGVIRLTELAGICPEQIQQVIFAGGFGSHIDPKNAAAIGLIPGQLAEKCVAGGNTAGLGAVKAALSEDFLCRLEELARRVTYFELSGDARFNELFAENMLFEE